MSPRLSPLRFKHARRLSEPCAVYPSRRLRALLSQRPQSRSLQALITRQQPALSLLSAKRLQGHGLCAWDGRSQGGGELYSML